MAKNSEEARLETPKQNSGKTGLKLKRQEKKQQQDEKSANLGQRSSNVRLSIFRATIG